MHVFCLFEKRKKIGNDITATPHEDKIVDIGILDGLLVGFGNSRKNVASQLETERDIFNALCRNGPLGCSLCEIILCRSRQQTHNGVDIFVVYHAENNPKLLASLPSKLFT